MQQVEIPNGALLWGRDKRKTSKNREQGQAQKKTFEKKYNEYLKTGKKEWTF